ncbi:MAG: leucyl aminopeptidase family protein [Planctomycetota bacterium]
MIESVTLVSRRGTSDVLVLGHFKGAGLSTACRTHDEDGSITAALRRPDATGELGVVIAVTPSGGYSRVLVVGLGDRGKADEGRFRTAAGAVGKVLSKMQAKSALLCFAGPIADATLDANLAGVAFGEGLGLLTFDHEQYKGAASTRTTRPKLAVRISDHFETDDFAHGVDYGLGLAESANESRRLSTTPPNICNPPWVAKEAQKMGRKVGLKVDVFSGAALDKHKLVGIKTVGDASESKPCLIRMEYTPPGGGRGRGGRPLVLVGKTMTYDSGGLNLKVGPGGPKGMKQDMDGGSAVFGAMHACATVIQPRKRVVAYLSCAENSISDEAYRPDDILTYANGVTVEVTNTDAEGRLVLADALAYTCAHDRPAAIVDIATLTGGVVVALGRAYAGIWCDDDSLREKLIAAGERTGEPLWRLPHSEHYNNMMRSDTADIWNSAPVREAHASQGAAFLSYFVKPGIPWAHVDIAGQIANKDGEGPFVKNMPNGFGARMLADLIEAF